VSAGEASSGKLSGKLFQHDVCRAFHDFINFINTRSKHDGVHTSHIVIAQSASGT